MRKSKTTESAPETEIPFTLSWTHYVQLLKIEDEDERSLSTEINTLSGCSI